MTDYTRHDLDRIRRDTVRTLRSLHKKHLTTQPGYRLLINKGSVTLQILYTTTPQNHPQTYNIAI